MAKKASKKKVSKKKVARKTTPTAAHMPPPPAPEVPVRARSAKAQALLERKRAEFGDLPVAVLDQLSLSTTTGPKSGPIYDILKEGTKNGEPMDVNDIVLALWKQSHQLLTRKEVYPTVSHLATTGKIRRCGLGSYVVDPE